MFFLILGGRDLVWRGVISMWEYRGMKHNITILVQKSSDQPAVLFVLFCSIRNLPLEPAPVDMGREPLGEKTGTKENTNIIQMCLEMCYT